MGDLFVPLLLSVASFAAGFYARNRGSRWLLLILGGATAAGLILIMGAEAMAVAADCTGPSVREMTCPSPSVITSAALAIGKFGSLASLPGLIAGPVAVPIAALAEYWTRRNARRG
ncbi:MAG: hypothetical protein ACPH5G_14705 [Pseudooceanicola atlanticus]|jgi:hypothetical protein